MIFSIAFTVLCTSSRSYFSGRLRRRSISKVASCSQQELLSAGDMEEGRGTR